jgi:hypothetical protein
VSGCGDDISDHRQLSGAMRLAALNQTRSGVSALYVLYIEAFRGGEFLGRAAAVLAED